MATIHIAYAYERRTKSYRARGYVGEYRKPLHSVAVAIGDTADEAIRDCVAHINAMHDRDNIARPADVTKYGKVAGITLDHLAF